MKVLRLRVLAPLSLLALGACAESGSEPAGPGLQISVAPLQLQGISDACYDILIESSTPDGVGGTNDVVSLTNICASQYGSAAGGDITYIAPCDASVDDNWVTVWPELLGTQGALTDWQDPCGTDGCQLQVACNENEDTLVEFNLTIMREANQGFFDVAVNFSDIFCSAKVDCRYGPSSGAPQGSWIRSVHGSDGKRTATAVMAFACTGGNAPESAGATHLYASNARVSCDPDNDPGTPRVSYDVVVDSPGNVYTTNPDGPIDQAMVFMGAEALSSGGTNLGKVYWNVAIGLDELAPLEGSPADAAPQIADGRGCVLEFTATASEGPLDLDVGNAFLSYPFMVANVQLTDSTGTLVCDQNPLNGSESDFTTVYMSAIPAAISAGWSLNAASAAAGQAAPTTPVDVPDEPLTEGFYFSVAPTFAAYSLSSVNPNVAVCGSQFFATLEDACNCLPATWQEEDWMGLADKTLSLRGVAADPINYQNWRGTGVVGACQYFEGNEMGGGPGNAYVFHSTIDGVQDTGNFDLHLMASAEWQNLYYLPATLQVLDADGETCVVETDNEVSCYEQAEMSTASFAARLPAGLLATSIALSSSTACVIDLEGTLQCWTSDGSAPTTPTLTDDLVSITAGSGHICAVDAFGNADCAGVIAFGGPVDPTVSTGWKTMSAGNWHTCGIKSDDTVACWGRATGWPHPNPPAAQTATHIVSGYANVCLIEKTTNDVKCWGAYPGASSVPVPAGLKAKQLVHLDGQNVFCATDMNDLVTCFGATAGRTTLPANTTASKLVGTALGVVVIP